MPPVLIKHLIICHGFLSSSHLHSGAAVVKRRRQGQPLSFLRSTINVGGLEQQQKSSHGHTSGRNQNTVPCLIHCKTRMAWLPRSVAPLASRQFAFPLPYADFSISDLGCLYKQSKASDSDFEHIREDYPASSTYACEDTSSYYSHVKHLRGEALKKKLNSIVAPHHSLSYKEVWDALKFLDAANVDEPNASSGVVEIYSLRVVSKRLSGKPQGWNREHLWPRSYGLTNGPSLTDLHNIRPADANVNASRGNKYYGECEAKSSKCLKPANKEAALDTETDKERWAPPRQVRGDIARALMYMEVGYGVQQSGRTPGLRLSDAPNTKKKEMGLLSTLLKWNEVDPPSREERLRNERICKFYQHNRNPFVDHPEYAKLIWNQPLSTPPPNTTINISGPNK